MKLAITLLCGAAILSGCGGSSGAVGNTESDVVSNSEVVESTEAVAGANLVESVNAIDGVWVSNCHALTFTDDGEFIADVIDTYDFTDGSYTLTSQYYTDSTCTVEADAIDLFEGEYTILDNAAIASDGEEITTAAFTQSSPDWPVALQPAEFDLAFRVQGNDLFFASIQADNTIEISLDVTYTRQIN